MERIEDSFFDMTLAEQDHLLGVLNTLHRLKRRQGSDRFAEPAKATEQPKASEQPLLDGVAGTQ